jgi:queuosine precursor transporter
VGDVLTEVYGFHRARRVIWLGFFCNLIAVLAIWLGGIMPAAPFWKAQEAYNTILDYTPRLLVASFLAYLIGEFANSIVVLIEEAHWVEDRLTSGTYREHYEDRLDNSIYKPLIAKALDASVRLFGNVK